MHSGLQTIAHRAPAGAAASRTSRGVRFQPYTSNMPIPTRTPSSSYMNTPTSVSSSPSPYSTPATSHSSEPVKSVSTLTKDPSYPKHKQLSLVDQAIKTLNNIWRPEDIPAAFMDGHRQATPSILESLALQSGATETLLKTQSYLPTPYSPAASTPIPSSRASAFADHESSDNSKSYIKGHVPIKGFVHEVLRRSKTSGHVLQTALCYVEAVRPKIMELMRLEKLGEGCKPEPDIASRITIASPEDFEMEFVDSAIDADVCTSESLATVRLSDSNASAPENDTLKKPKGPSQPLEPLPPLPSPLLCPRRAFLAALILASKFTQDKCYSNRAWAKVSNLPAREISRCERALGDALDWRLWVGKAASAAPPVVTPAPPLPMPRTIPRCRSESNLLTPIGRADKFLQVPDPTHRSGSDLRRSSTLPPKLFDQPLSGMYSPAATPHLSQHQDGCPPTELIDPNPPATFYSPSTPGLTYSPSSTESSLGDYTVQMSVLTADLRDQSFISVDTIPPYYEDFSWLQVPNLYSKAHNGLPLSALTGRHLNGSTSYQSSLDMLNLEDSTRYPGLMPSRPSSEQFPVGFNVGTYGGGYLSLGVDTISCC